MKTKSCKAKGRKLQNFVRDELVRWLNVSPNSIHVAMMGERGVDVGFKTLAFECANQEALNIWSKLEQAKINAALYGKQIGKQAMPIVVMKRNRSEAYAVIRFENLMQMLVLSNAAVQSIIDSAHATEQLHDELLEQEGAAGNV